MQQVPGSGDAGVPQVFQLFLAYLEFALLQLDVVANQRELILQRPCLLDEQDGSDDGNEAASKDSREFELPVNLETAWEEKWNDRKRGENA